ncbi:dicarboxylate/amino acid:cation symporter [Oceanivirga miroungae]|uniref:Sodium:dicarboxylate symporter n=1 Tax=Oceanivirga miroungae TaxID=1130046 RepID=A0A6I8MCF9_9FUSO|nr:dicarboxylate/amino acid:cation symporter [Oceanivirga miroungae]VWL84799.1 sodium:dicarboxylate symporter [Oceanivirga miroungae]
MKLKLGLVSKLLVAIVLGILIGKYTPLYVVRLFKTFSVFFGSFLSFFIPLMIVGFVVMGIARLSSGAGKLLGLTTGISYISTIIAGLFSYTVAANVYPRLINSSLVEVLQSKISDGKVLVNPYFTIPLKAFMDVTAAIVLAFMLGLTISYIKSKNKESSLFNVFDEYEKVIKLVLSKFIIPLLPIHILGIFSELAYTGQVFSIISIFIKIYLCIFIIHYIYMLVMYFIAGSVSKKNPFKLMKNQIPAYLTAVGTQSSAATIPVNAEVALKNGVSKEVANFVIPLCATIHLSGSMITLTSCIMGILLMMGMPHSFGIIIPFICMLGIAMVAAPGAPGGAVMSALPFLYMVGISSNGALSTLLIALYITQDSFGTAINVSGDNAIAIYVDEFYKKYINKVN